MYNNYVGKLWCGKKNMQMHLIHSPGKSNDLSVYGKSGYSETHIGNGVIDLTTKICTNTTKSLKWNL